jgi:hypothetical protein
MSTPSKPMIRSVLLAVVAVAGLTYGILQAWEVTHRDNTIAQLNRQIAAASASADGAKAALDAVKQELAAARENIERLKAERDAALAKAKTGPAEGLTSQPPAAAASAEGEKPGGFGAFAKMFESEEGRKMMKSQTIMGTRMMYAELGRKLGLSPQDAEQVMALLGDRAGAMAEAQFKRMAGGQLDEATAKQMAEENKAIKAEYDTKLKGMIGEQKFSEMQEYEKTLGDRMMMTQYDQQFNAAGVPLQGEQREALLAIMADERKKSPPSVFDNSGQDVARNFSAMRDDTNFDKFFEQEAAYQQRVLDSATKALNPDQINALRQGFKQWGDMQKFGMKMMQGMMKGEGGKAPAPPAPVPK